MKRPTQKQWAIFIANLLMIVPGTYVLRVHGWKLWLAFIAFAVGLRMAGYVEGQESVRR